MQLVNKALEGFYFGNFSALFLPPYEARKGSNFAPALRRELLRPCGAAAPSIA
jgi:hypothetical protein